MNKQLFLKIIAIVALFFLVIPWTFNHIDPWAGVTIFIVSIYLANNWINKYIK